MGQMQAPELLLLGEGTGSLRKTIQKYLTGHILQKTYNQLCEHFPQASPGTSKGAELVGTQSLIFFSFMLTLPLGRDYIWFVHCCASGT